MLTIFKGINLCFTFYAGNSRRFVDKMKLTRQQSIPILIKQCSLIHLFTNIHRTLLGEGELLRGYFPLYLWKCISNLTKYSNMHGGSL